MIKQNMYKYIPALATVLCACSIGSAQAINFHIGLDIPLFRPVRPVYVAPVYPVYKVCHAPRVDRCHHDVTDRLIYEIQHDLQEIHSFLRNPRYSQYAELSIYSRTIRNNWLSWIRAYRSAFGITVYELETIRNELQDIRHSMRQLRMLNISVHGTQYRQLRDSLMNVAVNIFSRAARWSLYEDDLRLLTKNLSEIRCILATI